MWDVAYVSSLIQPGDVTAQRVGTDTCVSTGDNVHEGCAHGQMGGCGWSDDERHAWIMNMWMEK